MLSTGLAQNVQIIRNCNIVRCLLANKRKGLPPHNKHQTSKYMVNCAICKKDNDCKREIFFSWQVWYMRAGRRKKSDDFMD